ncbi:hypothetical protein HYC85_026398 [Camellia sinensis]|uniref:Small ribosomal subunit protein uS3 C-terminal domain-containing protein n=1 Tax=Camellia sinensis TaxID=4442 RepID=A0A7J7G3J5_CAMSI|nr:hypothetical protein HYC85_026398 [Camellia sinensis]
MKTVAELEARAMADLGEREKARESSAKVKKRRKKVKFCKKLETAAKQDIYCAWRNHPKMAAQMSKKRKFVADGVFFAELNEVLTRELAEDRYSGVTPMRTEIIIRATRTFSDQRADIGCTETLLVSGRQWSCTPRKSITGTLCYCSGRVSPIQAPPWPRCSEVIVSGRLRAQRAKSMKFKDGYMISSGQPVNEYIDSAVRHVLLRQYVSNKDGYEKDAKGLITYSATSSGQLSIRLIIFRQTFFEKKLNFEVSSDHVLLRHAGVTWNQGKDNARLGSQGEAGSGNTTSRSRHNPYSKRGRGTHQAGNYMPTEIESPMA